jgi:hypothetical protein
MSLQAIIFSKRRFSKEEAAGWVKDHGYEPIKAVHVTKNFYRFRLKKPSASYRYVLRPLTGRGAGIKFVLGYHT